MDKPDIIAPIVHLNGTGAADLLRQQQRAIETLSEALTALCEAAPHGRDYYPLGDAAYLTARTQFDERVLIMNKMLAEMRATYRATLRQAR